MKTDSRSRHSALGARQLLLIAVLCGVAYYAIQGGEYSTVAIIRQRFERRAALRAIDSLQHRVDSLTRVRQAILTDPATQERIAREEFGMIKQKELLYRFAEPADSAARGKRP